MAAFYLAHWRVKPGRGEDWAELAASFRPIGERLGAGTQRFVQAIGDPQSGFMITWVAEVDDMAGVAALVDGVQSDPEAAEWVAKATAADSPVEFVGSGIATETGY